MMGGVSLSVIGNFSVPFYIAKKLRYKIPPRVWFLTLDTFLRGSDINLQAGGLTGVLQPRYYNNTGG